MPKALQKVVLGLGLAALAAFFPTSTEAAFSFEVTGATPATITTKEDVVVVTLGITDLPSESYFRVAWQKNAGDTYFGYVKNDKGEWTQIKSLSSGDCGNYYKVSDLSITSLTLEVKMGSEATAEPGDYSLIGHRFTASCSSNTVSSEASKVVITANIPTPSPSPTSSPTPSTTATQTQTPTPTSTKTPTPKPTPKPSVLADATTDPEETTPNSVPTSSPNTPNGEGQTEEVGKPPMGVFPIVFIGAGGILLGGAGIAFYKIKKGDYSKLEN